MNTNIFKEIELWVKEQYNDVKFTSLPNSILDNLNKEDCLKIMENKIFGYSSNDQYDIKYLPDKLKSDTEIAVLALELYSNNYFHLPDEVTGDVQFHRDLIKNKNIDYEYIFGHSPKSIRGNEVFINEIILLKPLLYDNLTDELRNNKTILLKVLDLKHCPRKVPLIFSFDMKVVSKLIDVVSYQYKRNQRNDNRDWLVKFISKELLADKRLVLKVYSKIKRITLDIPESLLNDKDVVLNSVINNPFYYEKIKNKLKYDQDILIASFIGDHKNFIEFGSKYHIDYSNILEFVKTLKKPINPRWAWEFDGNSGIFEKIVDKLVEIRMFKNDIAIHLASIWPDDIDFYKYFKLLDSNSKNRKEILLRLLKSSLSDNLKDSAIFKDKDNVTADFVFNTYIAPNHLDDKDLILESIWKAPSLFKTIPDILKSDSKTIIRASWLLASLMGCEKRDEELLKSISPDYFNDETFILELIETHQISDFFDKSMFKYASDILKYSDDFVKKAIKIQPQVIHFSSYRINNDIDFQEVLYLINK